MWLMTACVSVSNIEWTSLESAHISLSNIQRDSEEPLLDLWPFAVEASNFKEIWQERMQPVKEQVCQYLMWRKSRPENKITAEVEEKVEAALQELFWKLVKLRVKPNNERMTVLTHGAANLHNLMFSYDELSGRPNQVLHTYMPHLDFVWTADLILFIIS